MEILGAVCEGAGSLGAEGEVSDFVWIGVPSWTEDRGEKLGLRVSVGDRVLVRDPVTPYLLEAEVESFSSNMQAFRFEEVCPRKGILTRWVSVGSIVEVLD